mmetsp:Transcript_12369/g.31268  ORF Transcript_12369/g.31268 Transcript_12369/m.31268 type:complete len:300 (-) Transcript_12369:153-1052(-)
MLPHRARDAADQNVVDGAAKGVLHLLHLGKGNRCAGGRHAACGQAGAALARRELERRRRVGGQQGHEGAVEEAVDEDPKAAREVERWAGERDERGGEERERAVERAARERCSLALRPAAARRVDRIRAPAVEDAQKHLEHRDAVGEAVVEAHEEGGLARRVGEAEQLDAPERERPVPRERKRVADVRVKVGFARERARAHEARDVDLEQLAPARRLPANLAAAIEHAPKRPELQQLGGDARAQRLELGRAVTTRDRDHSRLVARLDSAEGVHGRRHEVELAAARRLTDKQARHRVHLRA